ncbi:MAG: hypothetical protein AAGI38_06830 [Bacteroidota bacterium]
MKYALIMALYAAICSPKCFAQRSVGSDTLIKYTVNENVKNSEEPYFIEIRGKWESYLNENAYLRRDQPHWNHELYAYPEMGYVSFLMYMRGLLQEGGNIQCSFIGIVPVEHDFYLLKTVFTQKNRQNPGLVDIKFIVSVYVKKEKDSYQFYSSTQYYKEKIGVRKVGRLSYLIHPAHHFNEANALKMDKFNEEMAELFDLPPLQFDYVVANNTRDLADIFGLHLFEYSYQPVASGGMADVYNSIIYAGNGSEYYPHEVVHMYTHAKYPGQYHSWIDEGIAALLGGSTGYKIEWHWEKVRRFLVEHPDYDMSELSKLEAYVPNGEYITDFRYAIGALICQKIIDKEGMEGIFDALQGGRTEADYFVLLERKLGIEQNEFEDYVKTVFRQLTPIDDTKMENFSY